MDRPDSSTDPRNRLRHSTTASTFNALDWLATLLLIIGGLNWGLVGTFGVDLVASLFGTGSAPSRGVYILLGLSALYGLYLMSKMGRAGNAR